MTVHFRAIVHDGMEEERGLQRDAASPFKYPGGELHLKDVFENRSRSTVWIADVRFGPDGDQDLTYAAMLANIAHQRQAPFVLFLPYLPAARSDKVGYLKDPIGVEVYADRINAMNPQQVISIDIHSPVAHRYVRNLTELKSLPLIKRSLRYEPQLSSQFDKNFEHYDGVIVPDKGAIDRASWVAKNLGVWGIPFYQADKKRDLETGDILGIEMVDELPPEGRYIVVDDICDGGGTFIGLAEATGLPREQLTLWVTHGIFSGQAQKLRRHYGQIYTTDSHQNHHKQLVPTQIVPVESYMYQNLKEFG
jgi:ribose-phosphate pyrophosphokinase